MAVATISATCRWGAEMQTVIVSYVCPPIPTRSADWCAYLEQDEGEEGAPCGWGVTKLGALEDLLSQLDPDDEQAKAVWNRINDIERQW